MFGKFKSTWGIQQTLSLIREIRNILVVDVGRSEIKLILRGIIFKKLNLFEMKHLK